MRVGGGRTARTDFIVGAAADIGIVASEAVLLVLGMLFKAVSEGGTLANDER